MLHDDPFDGPDTQVLPPRSPRTEETAAQIIAGAYSFLILFEQAAPTDGEAVGVACAAAQEGGSEWSAALAGVLDAYSGGELRAPAECIAATRDLHQAALQLAEVITAGEIAAARQAARSVALKSWQSFGQNPARAWLTAQGTDLAAPWQVAANEKRRRKLNGATTAMRK